MLSDPFFECYKMDANITDPSNGLNEFLYLKLIEKIIFARFLQLSGEENKKIRDTLTFIKANSKKEVSKLADRVRNKLYRYKGVKCPPNLIYISLIEEDQAKSIAEYHFYILHSKYIYSN